MIKNRFRLHNFPMDYVDLGQVMTIESLAFVLILLTISAAAARTVYKRDGNYNVDTYFIKTEFACHNLVYSPPYMTRAVPASGITWLTFAQLFIPANIVNLSTSFVNDEYELISLLLSE
ncbi:hypothetical protein J6590_053186 [Homalodisca vitripennis]|nr:hypothetical protein J6590_053186 [Homalodisca vitripennis]